MYQVNVMIEGIADFLFNRMSEEAQATFIRGTTGGTVSEEQRDKEAENKVYADGAGLYLPPWTFKRALLDGARQAGLKLNKKPLQYRLAAVVFVQGAARFENKKGKPVMERDYLHKIPGRTPPKKGGMTIVRRPALKAGWRLRGQLAVLDDGVPPDAIRAAYDAAGLYVGIGSWRPELGRFIVKEFTGDPS